MHGMKNLVTLKALPSTQAQRANLGIEIYRLNHWNAVSSGRGVITHDEAVIGKTNLYNLILSEGKRSHSTDEIMET